MSIVENIKLLCKEKGTTIPKLGTELGFGNGAVYNWDKNSPSIDKLQKVADYFEVSIEKVLYGFDLSGFEGLLRILVGQKTIDEVAKASDVDAEILEDYLIGIRNTRPDIEFVEKLAAYNPYEILFCRADLLEAAGYGDVIPKTNRNRLEQPIEEKPYYALTAKDERDIARDLDRMMNDLESQEALAFYGEEVEYDDEAKELLRMSMEQTMRLAKQLAKKKFTPKKTSQRIAAEDCR